MEKENLESGFRVNNLLLMESSFKREWLVTLDLEQLKKLNAVVNLDIKCNVQGDLVVVTETLDYSHGIEGKIEVSAKIQMVGVFEKTGTPELSLEDFGNVNGAAIIFPYIREHLSNLSVKAGINPILLAPGNFAKGKTKD